MDLMKIGRYIAGKRRTLGMTQRGLAEKLGMSDKSVSKWERGVCLPDVSIYSELCRILGISLNEFLSGEDIPKEKILQKADENILGVMKDSKRKLFRSKIMICILLVFSLIFLSVFSIMLFQSHRPQNYIYPVDRDSVEMKIANMLSGPDSALLYRDT